MGAREVEITAAQDREVSAPRTGRTDRRTSAPVSGLAARLEAAGFEPAIAADVAARARHGIRRAASAPAVRRAVAEWLAPLVADDSDEPCTEVFIGPPGAGKTTTIAKLAAQARVQDGMRLPLVSTDVSRIGATEPLREYARILGSAFHEAATVDELLRLVPSAPGPLLVDTPGGAARQGLIEPLLGGLRTRGPVRTHLVVPAGTSAREIERLVARHRPAHPDCVVLTKVDETESAAAIAGVLRDSGLRVSWLGTGQRVPEDLCRATPGRLAAALLGELTTEHAA
jgi:flagellar biosynthesis protein FlhF